jgi:hypothetical protein
MAGRTVWCDNNSGQNPPARDFAFRGEGVWPKSSVRLKEVPENTKQQRKLEWLPTG